MEPEEIKHHLVKESKCKKKEIPKKIEHDDDIPNAGYNPNSGCQHGWCRANLFLSKTQSITVQPVYLVRIGESKSQSALPKQVTNKWSNPADAAFCFVVGLKLKPRLHFSIDIILKTERRLSKVSEDDEFVEELGSDSYAGSYALMMIRLAKVCPWHA